MLSAGGEHKGDRRETKAKPAMAAMASYQELRVRDKASVLEAASHVSPGCLAPSHLVSKPVHVGGRRCHTEAEGGRTVMGGEVHRGLHWE